MLNAIGYFGSGVSLSGSGTDLYTCTSGASTKLNAIYQSMTVAFWIKPDVDYVASGTGWAWSFGRKDLWRVGFDLSVPGLRFSVNDPTAGWRSAAAVFPLYTGRWVHVAAVLANGQDGPFRWSNLSVYANGERIAYASFTSWTSARTGNAFLYLGWDEASGTSAGRFKGAIDEFRLYSTALNQSAVRGLLWFLHGANNLLIPRGIFYDSKLYGGLNGSYSASAPFAGATAYGNSNNLSSNLNSRVIQMVIAKNLTLAQAWGILDLARTNMTNSVTAFPYFATSEFYTLGLSWEVSKLTANTSVVNGGNYSYPPPPANWWQLFWNTIAGFAAYVWNAAVAVGAFFTNVGKWLVQAALAYVKGLTTGNWTDFQRNVLEPIRKALSAFLQALEDLIKNTMALLFAPLTSALSSVVASIAGYLTLITSRNFDPSPLGIAALALEGLVRVAGAFVLALTILAGILMVIENAPPILLLKPTFMLFRNFVVFVLTPIILVAVLGLSIPVNADAAPRNPGPNGGAEVLRERVPNDVQFYTELPYTISDFLLEMIVVSATPEKELPFGGTASAVLDAGISLAIDTASAYIDDPREALFWDLFSLVFGLMAWGETALDPAGEEVPLTSTIATSLATVAIALALNSIAQDAAAISRGA